MASYAIEYSNRKKELECRKWFEEDILNDNGK